MPYLTPEAKAQLSTTIRGLRTRLLTDLKNEADSTYLLAIKPINRANLAEEPHKKRERLEAWLDEQVRAELGGVRQAPQDDLSQDIRDRHFSEAIKLAAATLLNRLVVLRQLEAMGLSRPLVVTGGWSSPGYRQFREFALDLCKDDTEGYALLLGLLYEELALELPGLFGPVSLTELFPIPASTLRTVIEELNALDPNTWRDDITLGWIYQFWNDPDREALDDKLDNKGKLESYEIASKTQIFTERYMVEWLLHNSLGQIWLAMCEQNGWTSEIKSSGTLDGLEERRKAWREKREKGEVTLDALMPIESEMEDRWKYWVPQPMLSSLETGTGQKQGFPDSLRDIKILDPACGSGHFLVIALGLLFALYQEEARHRGEPWSDKAIVEWILERNLYGVDLDTRAVQIAAASLWLKAKVLCPEASPKQLNLVASNLNLDTLPEDDPALVELRREVAEATGVSEELTNQVVEVLEGADQWGSLLKIDEAIREVVRKQEQEDMPLFSHQQRLLEFEEKIRAIDAGLERFLQQHTRGDDLGLRLRGEQLAAGVRFIRIVREASYDLVIGNPPYQSTGKMQDAKYMTRHYQASKADLYAAFLQRGLEMITTSGLSALLTGRNWMFTNRYEDTRQLFLENYSLKYLGDFDRGAFESLAAGPGGISVAASIFCKTPPTDESRVLIIRPSPIGSVSHDFYQKKASLLVHHSFFTFKQNDFEKIPEKPLIYWWDAAFLNQYSETKKIQDKNPAKKGLVTSNNKRFIRYSWELGTKNIYTSRTFKAGIPTQTWCPVVSGAEQRKWIEPLRDVISWQSNGLEVKVFNEFKYVSYSRQIMNEEFYFKIGTAFTVIGSNFSARAHRYSSILEAAGSSVFTDNVPETVCLMNSSLAKFVLESLNPTANFKNGDVNRLPLFPIESSGEIFSQLDNTFGQHEAAHEISTEFKQPNASCWAYAQGWAQQAVDRPAGDPLPNWQPTYNPPPAKNWVSYAIGIALGRFHPHGQGILNPESEETSQALPYGILYLSDYANDTPDSKDSLNHSACSFLKDTWAQYGDSVAHAKSLREWLRLNFFKDVHVGMYDQRPIYFPLSSEKKHFVAYINIHRWTATTLTDLLAHYLTPELKTLEGELADLLDVRNSGDPKAQVEAQKQANTLRAYYDDLKPFIDRVRQCAEQGPPKANSKDPNREANAKYLMDLDDGVMVNSAALWPLLEPQWANPKKWWSELCTAQGKKDYDWSHLAVRYFPQRVDSKCQKDPSLAVAHGCFWQYHPAKAYEWELRLQDEIAPDFTLDEQNSDTHRQEFEEKYPQLVEQLIEKEEKRRERNRRKAASQEESNPLSNTPLDIEQEY